MSKKIIHIDMDCFYAAIEMRDNPSLTNQAIAVGGDSPRSVLCTCNYVARKYGVRSAMSSVKAKQLCPELKIFPVRMDYYKQVSKQIQAIFKRYTQLIEPLSLDEAYLDVSTVELFDNSATRIAQAIRKDIFNETQLTASAGVAPNKFLAKIASDENKPNGLCVIAPEKVAAFVEQLPLTKIPGIGKKTAAKLARFDLFTCADVRAKSIDYLMPIVGKMAASLYQKAHGIDNRELVTERQRKSVAVETTLATDIDQFEQALMVIENLVNKLEIRAAPYFDAISGQGVKLKFNDFKQTTLESKISYYQPGLFKDLLQQAMKRMSGRKIRLLGLYLQLGKKNYTGQLSLI